MVSRNEPSVWKKKNTQHSRQTDVQDEETNPILSVTVAIPGSDLAVWLEADFWSEL